MVKPRNRGEPRPPKIHEVVEPPHADAALFREAVKEVRPLTPTGRAAPRGRPSPGGALRRTGAERPQAPPEHLPLLPETLAPEELVGGGDVLSFRRPGVRDQEMRRLRRGLIPVEDVLDLHGLHQAAARDSLSDFLDRSRAAGRRCVRIVHGKGYRSGARGPVLKIAVNAWLRRHGGVVAFTSARTLDGGTGAVYVLLRA